VVYKAADATDVERLAPVCSSSCAKISIPEEHECTCDPVAELVDVAPCHGDVPSLALSRHKPKAIVIEGSDVSVSHVARRIDHGDKAQASAAADDCPHGPSQSPVGVQFVE
jgi:hypothetical protein